MSQTTAPVKRGFTLVELLVVVAIIGMLAAIATPMITRARQRASTSTAENRINELTLALEQYQGQFGDYPPSSIEDFYGLSGNGLDEGCESLVLHLSTQKRGGPFIDWDEDSLENLDQDSVNSPELKLDLDWIFGNDELREVIDPWGTPYFYIHNRDYEKTFFVSHGEDHTRVSMQAARSEKMATFQSPTQFQLWSAGPNRKNENGSGDDIVSW